MKFNECNNCHICCSGFLQGSAYGHDFGNGKKCYFLNSGCDIYQNRPKLCHKYFCAWKQNLFPEWMQPNKCGVLISVENNGDKQFLKAISINEPSQEVINELEKFSLQNECEIVYVKLQV